jgi:hypothetical protein
MIQVDGGPDLPFEAAHEYLLQMDPKSKDRAETILCEGDIIATFSPESHTKKSGLLRGVMCEITDVASLGGRGGAWRKVSIESAAWSSVVIIAESGVARLIYIGASGLDLLTEFGGTRIRLRSKAGVPLAEMVPVWQDSLLEKGVLSRAFVDASQQQERADAMALALLYAVAKGSGLFLSC